MAWPAAQKHQTRQKIVDTAMRLFSLHGYEKISIGDVMTEAELTHGGFYHHFASKLDLYREAIYAALAQGKAVFSEVNADNIANFIKEYLSEAHCFGTEFRCPLSAMTVDMLNGPEEIRIAYNKSLNAFVAAVQARSYRKTASETGQISKQEALQISITLIGGMTLARAVINPDDAREILSASQHNALKILGDIT